jgi:hypothetical protein
MMARTTVDLIAEMRQEAARDGVMRAGLIVGFEERTEFVWSHDNHDSFRELNDLVQAGGEAVGMATIEGGWLADGGEVRLRPLAEYEDNEFVLIYLSALQEQTFTRHAGKTPRSRHLKDIKNDYAAIEQLIRESLNDEGGDDV